MFEIHWQLLLAQAITFIIGVTLLWKIFWKPLTKRLAIRQGEIRKNLEEAERQRQQMEQLRKDYETQLSQIEEKARQLINQAVKEGQNNQDQIIRQAREEAKHLLEIAQQQLLKEKAAMLDLLKKEVINVSILATEKLVQHSLDRKIQEHLLNEFFKNLEQPSKEKH